MKQNNTPLHSDAFVCILLFMCLSAASGIINLLQYYIKGVFV